MRRCGAGTRKARLASPGSTSLAPLAAAALLVLSLLHALPAHANVEEFSTFDIGLQEHDDEGLFDHYLTRFPLPWIESWAHSTAGLRTSQGCLTSGEWFIDTDLRARAPMGDRSWLGIDYFQSESDMLHTDHLDLSFHFPMPRGGAFAMFRPSAAKAAQDFALGWETGADTSAFAMRATWTLEDVFNNFWAFRQTQVGGLSEPYEQRPYEPALAIAVRQPGWWIETNAKWLTPSRKRLADVDVPGLVLERHELWGAAGQAQAGLWIGPWLLEARTDHRQAREHDTPITSGVDALNWRRQWSAEGALRTEILPRTTFEVRYVYQSRTQRTGALVNQGFLNVEDRMLALEFGREMTPRLAVRVGGMYDRIGVARTNWPDFTWGTRKESRAYVGLAARFGRVLVSGTEGIELDHEVYDVWLVHDKGFLQLQTTF